MSYKKIPEIPKAERLEWSPEKGGRLWMRVGGHKVRKFAFSPFTSKPRTEYSFYADVEISKPIEYPLDKKGGEPQSTKRNHLTLLANVGTYLEFRDEVLSGRMDERLNELVEAQGGEGIVDVGFWRNRGENRVTGENR